MPRPGITNVWATRLADRTCRRVVSRLVIEGTSSFPYRVRLTSPLEMRVDLPGSELVMAPGDVAVNDGLVAGVSIASGPPSPFAIVRLEHEPPWTATQVPGTPFRLVVDMDRSPVRAAFEGRVVAVDAGHGGSDPGGRGPVNLVEKKVVLEIARLLASLLSLAGADVLMTRSSDEPIPRSKRLAQARAACADAFVSVHAFATLDRRVAGARTLWAGVPESEALARHVQSSLLERLPVPDRGVARYQGRLPADFSIPCVLAEVATISNWVEEGWLRSTTFKERAAEAIATGLKRYFLESAPRSAGSTRRGGAAGAAIVGADAIPIRTHLVRENEDIVEVVRRYAGPVAHPGDVIAVAESVVAITQGRAVLPESLRPGLLARVLCRFPGKDGSLATPPAMQLAIREVGAPRVLLGTVAAGLGRAVGRRGDFFRVAGRSLAQIDDIAGTMPPYDKHVVLGPAAPGDVARRIKAATGVDAVVADVNDLGCVDVLGSTTPCAQDWVTRALVDNPFGNDDQQTPIVVLRPRG